MTQTTQAPDLDGIDRDDMVVHARIPGTMRSYCGLLLEDPSGYVPEAEVTSGAWCEDCIEAADA